MEKFKNLFFQHFDKMAIALAFGLFLYAISDFYKSSKPSGSIEKIQEFSSNIENNIRTSKAPEPVKLSDSTELENTFARIEKQIDDTEEEEVPVVIVRGSGLHDVPFEPGQTDIIYKGGTPDKALITIIKIEKEDVFEQSFAIKIGEKIGENAPVIGNKVTDFMTGCTLIGIISDAKKELNMQKKVAKVNENGEYDGTETKFEPYFVNSMKIKYRNERLGGKEKELWLGDTANLGTITALINADDSSKK